MPSWKCLDSSGCGGVCQRRAEGVSVFFLVPSTHQNHDMKIVKIELHFYIELHYSDSQDSRVDLNVFNYSILCE